jgi:hypothetical protein
MRIPARSSWRSADAGRRAPSVTGGFPGPAEALTEIGLLLTIHLAAAFAAVLTLRLFGIA